MPAILALGSLDGDLVSEVPVDIVPAATGGSGAARVITYGIIFNADDQAIAEPVELSIYIANVTFGTGVAATRRRIWRSILDPNESWTIGELGERLVLTIGRSLQASLAGPISLGGNQPTFYTCWEDWV